MKNIIVEFNRDEEIFALDTVRYCQEHKNEVMKSIDLFAKSTIIRKNVVKRALFILSFYWLNLKIKDYLVA